MMTRRPCLVAWEDARSLQVRNAGNVYYIHTAYLQTPRKCCCLICLDLVGLGAACRAVPCYATPRRARRETSATLCNWLPAAISVGETSVKRSHNRQRKRSQTGAEFLLIPARHSPPKRRGRTACVRPPRAPTHSGGPPSVMLHLTASRGHVATACNYAAGPLGRGSHTR